MPVINRPVVTLHRIEFGWSTSEPTALRAHCRECDEYLDSNPLPDTDWRTLRIAQNELRRIFTERPCVPDLRPAVIVGGNVTPRCTCRSGAGPCPEARALWDTFKRLALSGTTSRDALFAARDAHSAHVDPVPPAGAEETE